MCPLNVGLVSGGGGWEERGTGTSFAGRALGGLSLIPTLLLEMEGGGGLECEGGAAGENHVDRAPLSNS